MRSRVSCHVSAYPEEIQWSGMGLLCSKLIERVVESYAMAKGTVQVPVWNIPLTQ